VTSWIWPLLPHGVTGKNFLRRVSRDAQGRFLDEIGYFQADEKEALLTHDLRRQLKATDTEARLAIHFNRFSRLPWQAQMMRFDLETYLPEDILTKVDRMSMAVSLEAREPLLDHKLLEFAATVPSALKLKGRRSKYLLRRLLSRHLPASIVDRPKHGFEAPIGGWLRGPLAPLVGDLLLDGRLRQRGIFNSHVVAQMWNEHRTGRRDHRHRIWSLVMLELWFRSHVDHSSSLRAGIAAA
jgi:asparagine synthase (glutamine-hydrolysing)